MYFHVNADLDLFRPSSAQIIATTVRVKAVLPPDQLYIYPSINALVYLKNPITIILLSISNTEIPPSNHQ